MKATTEYWADYRGWVITRLEAQGKIFKETAEQVWDKKIKAIWAVGAVAGDGDFDETSDIELIFETVDGDQIGADWDLQQAIEEVQKDVGFIQCYYDVPDTDERKVLIID
jgi:hypothetical protein